MWYSMTVIRCWWWWWWWWWCWWWWRWWRWWWWWCQGVEVTASDTWTVAALSNCSTLPSFFKKFHIIIIIIIISFACYSFNWKLNIGVSKNDSCWSFPCSHLKLSHQNVEAIIFQPTTQSRRADHNSQNSHTIYFLPLLVRAKVFTWRDM